MPKHYAAAGCVHEGPKGDRGKGFPGGAAAVMLLGVETQKKLDLSREARPEQGRMFASVESQRAESVPSFAFLSVSSFAFSSVSHCCL